ncbi:hypothetical protein [Cyclobacterium qasimii]|uniref:Uncharacterized protein n=2 Tax=Cyclobacterium qasimii TaxID=1350429 RepID=S7X5S2_9BACT|nr:hypothetical protein [Cyclobacterium qasimii]EPR71433.1 hypothetical protein ADICYQ_0335 [Cyclobacterium qasimii M12-11B]GEO23624.1 hypothetical protein CQA01_41580 [Cyclobacterium qasimii]
MIVDIEPVSLGISLAAILAFIAPIYISKKKQTNIQKSHQRKFTDEAEKNGLLLKEKDFWRGGYGIGIDFEKHKLLFMDPQSQLGFQLVSTDNISHLDMQKQSRHVGKGSNKSEIIDKLSLIINHSSEQSGKSILCFFDGDKHSDLSGEWPLIQKWNAILLKQIAASKHK